MRSGTGGELGSDFRDTFEPREFQRRLMGAVVRNHARGQKLTVAIASPGSGKTLGYQAAATELIRAGAITHMAVFAPRKALARQCELEYRNYVQLFDRRSRLEKITHMDNRPPLTGHGSQNVGYVTTYQSLTSNPELHLAWAREHKGRFLLVGDEAQFLGSKIQDGEDKAVEGGTKAGTHFKELAQYAAHTLLLTGTEKRSDDQPLVLARYDRREDGRDYLAADVRATYSAGIAQGYLRPLEAEHVNYDVARREESRMPVLQPLSECSTQLDMVVKHPGVWQRVTDKVLTRLRSVRQSQKSAKALIACTDQVHAREVHSYLISQGVSAVVAVSDDSGEAHAALESFKSNRVEVLVTVRMAFLGYDCKPITVVGLLTNYRDHGHLEQLVGRGLRISADAPAQDQVCHVVVPDDAAMAEFIESLLRESDRGIEMRQATSVGDFREAGVRESGSPVEVTGAWESETRVTGHGGEVTPEEVVLYRQLQEDLPQLAGFSTLSIHEVYTRMEASILTRSAPAVPPPPAPPEQAHPGSTAESSSIVDPYESPKTAMQLISDDLRIATGAINYAARQRVGPGGDSSPEIRRIRTSINKAFGVSSTREIRSEDAARSYRELTEKMTGVSAA